MQTHRVPIYLWIIVALRRKMHFLSFLGSPISYLLMLIIMQLYRHIVHCWIPYSRCAYVIYSFKVLLVPFDAGRLSLIPSYGFLADKYGHMSHFLYNNCLLSGRIRCVLMGFEIVAYINFSFGYGSKMVTASTVVAGSPFWSRSGISNPMPNITT